VLSPSEVILYTVTMMPPVIPSQQSMGVDEQARITYFGVTDTRGKHVPFGIKQDDRSKHTYVIGKSGMGKSTLLENMAVQDIQSGQGICFIDPHGGTAEKLLQYVPEHRVKDVLYFAPFDLQYPISFNVLENVDADKRHLVVAGLMSAFEKIWVDAWSARMAYILQNTIAALLEFPGATLLGVNRMYIDKEYRKNVIAHVTDPSVRSFWVDEFAKYTDRYAQEATPAIQNKIGQFASNALVRNVIGQEASSFNIRDIMDQRKIFIVNLSKGRVGEGNANLLGSMLITKIYLAAMSRADVTLSGQKTLPPFYLFVDEFQNFANKSFAEILSEARKYKLALTIAHQYIEQMEEEVRAAVFGNVGTMISFRVGAYDAEVLEKEYAPTFEIDDIVNLGARQIYLKLMIDSVSSQPFSATTLPPIPEPEVDQTDRAIAFSRAQYSRPRAEVEKAIKDWSEKRFEDPDTNRQDRQERNGEGRPPQREEGGSRPFRDNGGAPRPQERRYDARPPTQARSDSAPRAPERPYPPRPPRSDDSPRSPQRPAPPTRGGEGERTPFPRPLDRPTPVRKQDSRDALRSVLATLTKPEPSVAESKEGVVERMRNAETTPRTEREHAPDKKVVAPPLRDAGSKVAPPRSLRDTAPTTFVRQDDGKGVTDAGKEQLRSLLANLTKQESSNTQRPPTKDPAPDTTHLKAPVVPSVSEAPQVQHTTSTPVSPVPTPVTPPTTPQPVILAPRHPHPEKAPPIALSPEELRAMLQAKKPDM
jgi:hypothetical protein